MVLTLALIVPLLTRVRLVSPFTPMPPAPKMVLLTLVSTVPALTAATNASAVTPNHYQLDCWWSVCGATSTSASILRQPRWHCATRFEPNWSNFLLRLALPPSDPDTHHAFKEHRQLALPIPDGHRQGLSPFLQRLAGQQLQVQPKLFGLFIAGPGNVRGRGRHLPDIAAIGPLPPLV